MLWSKHLWKSAEKKIISRNADVRGRGGGVGSTNSDTCGRGGAGGDQKMAKICGRPL